jgi:methyl-accepting chemotaxis protein
MADIIKKILINKPRNTVEVESQINKNESTQKTLVWRRLNIRARLISAFGILLAAILIITGMASYSSSTNTIDEKVRSYSLELMNQIGLVLDREILEIESKFNDIMIAPEVQDNLSKIESSGDKYDSILKQKDIMVYMTDKFITSQNVLNCTLFYGKDFSQIIDYNSNNNLNINADQVIRSATDKMTWVDYDIETDSKKEKYFALQKNITEIKSGKIISKMVLIPELNFLVELFRNMNIGKDSKNINGFPIIVIDKRGKIISSRTTDNYPTGEANSASKAIANEIIKADSKNKSNSPDNIELEINNERSLVTYSRLTASNADWYIVAIVPYSFLNNAADKLKFQYIIIGVVCLVIAMLLCFMIALSISSPLNRLILSMEKAKEGDLTCRVSDNGKDEVAMVCQNYNDMLSNINCLISQARTTSVSVLNAANSIFAASDETHAALGQVAVTVDQIARGATDQAAEINDSSVNMDKLSEGIAYVSTDISEVIAITKKVNELDGKASKAIQNLIVKSDQVSDTSKKVSLNIGELSQSMNEIKSILKMIIGISRQTNLLSFNASIEASRAGVLGHGFTVVANEVNKLAEQTKEFTEKINNIITNIEKKTQDTVSEVTISNTAVAEQIRAVQESESIFKMIFQSMDIIIKSIGKTDISVKNIMELKVNVNDSLASISAVAEESAATTEEISASTQVQMTTAKELSCKAKELRRLSEDLMNEINKFKTE